MPFFLQCSNAFQSRSPIQMWQGLPLGPSMFCSDLQSQSMTQQLTSEVYARHGIYGYLWHNGYPWIMWCAVSVLPRSWDVWASLMQLDAIRTCMDFWHLSCWLKTAGPLRICSSDLSWDCTWRKEKTDCLSKNINSTRLMEITWNHSDLVSQRLSNMHAQQLAQFIAIFGIVQNQDMSSLAHFLHGQPAVSNWLQKVMRRIWKHYMPAILVKTRQTNAEYYANSARLGKGHKVVHFQRKCTTFYISMVHVVSTDWNWNSTFCSVGSQAAHVPRFSLWMDRTSRFETVQCRQVSQLVPKDLLKRLNCP